MTASFLHIGDVHLSDSPPGYRTETYTQDVLDKLSFCVDLAIDCEVDAILIVGDLFHHRSRVSHGLISDTIDVLATATNARIPVHILPGNHDLRENRLNTANRQPIGLVARALGTPLALHPFFVGPTPFDSFGVVPVPYIHGMTLESLSEYADRHLKDVGSSFPVLWVHNSITPNDRYPFPVLSTDSPDWNVPDDYRLIVAGHIHEDLGIWETGPTSKAFNVGALSRGSLTSSVEKFVPRVVLVSTESPSSDVELEVLDIPYRPAAEAFRIGDKLDKVTAEDAANEFVEALSATTLPSMFSFEDLKARVSSYDVSEPIKSKAVQAIEEVW